MNRLVIVGNGLDLAFGLKTKYEHFLKDYLIKCIKNLENNANGISEDELVKVEFLKSLRCVDYGKGLTKVIDLFDDLKIQEIINNEDISWKWLHNRNEVNKNNKSSKLIKIELKSRFFSKLIGERKWTDIEKAYFDELLEVFKKSKEDVNNPKRYTITNLNTDFDFLKSKVIEYLTSINNDFNNIHSLIRANPHDARSNLLYKIDSKCYENPKKEYLNRFFSKSKIKEQSNFQVLENIFFINFNYTQWFENHIVLNSKDFPITYYSAIHGNLNMPESIIFGYGDDSNKNYQDLEDEDNEEYLKNIKAFHYPNELHYLDIINALGDNEFDVFVIGHSLGLSDRVLLKTIFEHENCKAIKLFHRGSKESQFSKRIALSRHFTDKIKMRSKIVDYNEEDKI